MLLNSHLNDFLQFVLKFLNIIIILHDVALNYNLIGQEQHLLWLLLLLKFPWCFYVEVKPKIIVYLY